MMDGTKQRNVCVFCGAKSGSNPVFVKAAEELGKALAEVGWGLIYGGGTVGLMGAIARSAVESGGQVHGIIPSALLRHEANGDQRNSLGRITVVSDMHTRKRMMSQEADAFIAVPGGYGTLEEIAEVITWSQLGIHASPVVILNINDYFTHIMSWIDQAVSEGFISKNNRKIVVEVKTVADVIDSIRQYKVPEGRLDLDWSDQTPLAKLSHEKGPIIDSA